MTSRELLVRYGGESVGTLSADAAHRFTFTYAPSWVARGAAFPISISVPLGAEPYVDDAAHAFFANLLPEAGVRQAVCARLGISVGNDLELLAAIGGECAGALSIVAPDAPLPDSEHYRYEVLSAARLQALVTDEGVVPLLIGGAETRLSLAGAQDKLPLAVLEGRLNLSSGAAPSTHILKLPNPRYKHLPVNEAFVMGLAARIGLDVVAVELCTRTNPPSLLVTRYDRRAADGEDWPAIRLHQEDLCQALGLPPSQKYEKEGGPSFAEVVRTVREHVTAPLVDIRRLLEWQVFNVIAGNSDGHAKNLSLLHDAGTTTLAPFYDLLSTRHYDHLDRDLAMKVGGQSDPDLVLQENWRTCARELGVGARVVLGFVEDIAERCLAELPGWTKEFRERHGEQAVLQRLPGAITHRARRRQREVG